MIYDSYGGINWNLYPQNNVKILGVVLSPSTILEEMFVNWESKMDSIEKAKTNMPKFMGKQVCKR